MPFGTLQEHFICLLHQLLLYYTLIVTSQETNRNQSLSYSDFPLQSYAYLNYYNIIQGHLQLAHLADAPFEQFRRSIIFSVVILSTVTMLQKTGKVVISADDFDKIILVLLAYIIMGNKLLINNFIIQFIFILLGMYQVSYVSY